MNNLLNKAHFGLQIMKDKTISIDDTKIDGGVFAACGQGEEPRNYVTSWYGGNPEGELPVHIYLSNTLKSQQDRILQLLDKKLSLCETVDDLMALNNFKI